MFGAEECIESFSIMGDFNPKVRIITANGVKSESLLLGNCALAPAIYICMFTVSSSNDAGIQIQNPRKTKPKILRKTVSKI